MVYLENNNFINYAIVLKSKFNTISILDKKRGKINLILRSKLKLINGSYISYNIEKKINIVDIKIIIIPDSKDLVFFHHIIEICYYFLPLDCSENIDNIFSLISRLYNNKLNNLFKKLFLYSLFNLLNLYPAFIKANYSLNLNYNLKIWLTSCIVNQPYYKNLKTINFLKELDIYE